MKEENSVRVLLFLFLILMIALVGYINGEVGKIECDGDFCREDGVIITRGDM